MTSRKSNHATNHGAILLLDTSQNTQNFRYQSKTVNTGSVNNESDDFA